MCIICLFSLLVHNNLFLSKFDGDFADSIYLIDLVCVCACVCVWFFPLLYAMFICFPIFRFERHLVNVFLETRRAH